MLTSFERQHFDQVTHPEPAKQKLFNIEMQAFLFCFAKIFREICVENYKEFNGFNISSTRARTNVLASFNDKDGMNLRSL